MARQPQSPAGEELAWELNPRVLTAGFFRSAPGWRFRPTAPLVKDFYLWYIARGAGAVRISGRWLPFAAGDLVTIRPGERYEDERTDDADPSQIYFLHVLPFGRGPRRRMMALARNWPARLACPHPPKMRQLFAELFEVATLKPDRYPLRAKVLLLQVFESVLAQLSARGGTAGGAGLPSRAGRGGQLSGGGLRLHPADEKLRRAQEFIEQNVARPLTPDLVAEQADLSTSYLFALFKRHLGSSPLEYQAALRLRRAVMLLAEGRSVTAVAEAVGFSSVHYFSRLFKRRHGLAPSHFAARLGRK